MMTIKLYKYIILPFAALLSQFAIMVKAQPDSLHDARISTRTTMIGIGATKILDTYLSPEEYTGNEVRLYKEISRSTHWAKGRISTQTIVQGNFSYSKNRADTGNEMAGLFSYDIGWRYNWSFYENRLQLQVGGLFDANIGFIYNTRNSNNPAQAKLYMNIAPSIELTYHLRIKNHPLAIHYQANIPIVGVMFSPNYGQSYYEIFSEGNYDHNIVPTTSLCAPSLRQMLAVDFNLFSTTLRIGYLGDFQQSEVNNLKSHVYSNMLMIGVVKRFRLIKIAP